VSLDEHYLLLLFFYILLQLEFYYVSIIEIIYFNFIDTVFEIAANISNYSLLVRITIINLDSIAKIISYNNGKILKHIYLHFYFQI
jgi:hypothetical protein